MRSLILFAVSLLLAWLPVNGTGMLHPASPSLLRGSCKTLAVPKGSSLSFSVVITLVP